MTGARATARADAEQNDDALPATARQTPLIALPGALALVTPEVLRRIH